MAKQTTPPKRPAKSIPALGGAPTHPTQFQPIGKPSGGSNRAEMKTTKHPHATVQPSRPVGPPPRKVHTTFDDDPVAVAHRAGITTARQALTRLIATVDQCTDQLRLLIKPLEALDSGKEEAKRQGFNIAEATAFIEEIDAVIETRKPRATEPPAAIKPEAKH